FMSDTAKSSSSNVDVRQETHTKTNVLNAFRRLTRPLVKMLIRHGIAFGEFAEVLKTVYVDVAAHDFPLDDRKVSGSRIAILTGLTRKDVRRLQLLLAEPEGSLEATGNLNRATRVLSGWYQDSDFTGPYGIPLELPFDGPVSFSSLVRKY